MKVSIFVVTYKNENLLHTCLTSILHAVMQAPKQYDINITVLNNFETLTLSEEFKEIKIINNNARPSFSTGHLARSWNQCILHGIKDIENPDCDVLVLAQNDTVFEPEFFTECDILLNKYKYIQVGCGDELQIMTPESIKAIGIYDERFCNIGFQEADYFLRAILLYKDNVSINDTFHGRVHNPINNEMLITNSQSGFIRKDLYHTMSSKYHNISYRMFLYKWMGILPFRCIPVTSLDVKEIKDKFPIEQWDDYIKNIKVCAKQYMMYPYFESKLPDLDKKYINFTNYYDII
jgi:hypothetical protein